MTYNIIRLYKSGAKKIVKKNVSLEEAKKHCNDPNSRAKRSDKNQWFDGYTKA